MLAVLAYRTAALLARVLPPRASGAFAAALARGAFALRPPARRGLEANLARVLPRTPPRARTRLACTTFEQFARGFARFLAARPQDAVTIEGRNHLEEALRSGRGVIVLSAHLGDWERGAAVLAAHGAPLHLVARPHGHEGIERMFRTRRQAAGVGELAHGRLLSRTTRALRRGEWVALMADRGEPPSARTSVCAWAGAVAQRTGALVLPVVYVEEATTGAHLRIEAPLTPERCREGAFRDALAGWLARWPGRWAAFEPIPDGITAS